MSAGQLNGTARRFIAPPLAAPLPAPRPEGTAQPLDRDKQWATLRARLALRDFKLEQLEDDGGRPMYLVHRWSMTRSFSSLDAVEDFCRVVGGIAMDGQIDIARYTTPAAAFDLRDVDPERRAEVALSEIRIAKRRFADTRPRTMTPRDALSVLVFEADFVLVCAGNVAQGIALSSDDLLRLAQACARIETIAHEAGCAG